MRELTSIMVQGGIFVLLALTLAPMPALAQTSDQTSSGSPTEAVLSEGQLDQMLAPVALYPDGLLAQVLMAATYPLEIVQADRWLLAGHHVSLRGAELTQALQDQDWDPSVKALVPFPQVLHLLDGNIGWTEAVGNAFLADQGQVMASVQRLRQRAKAAGRLPSQAQEVVSTQDQAITIAPADPATVYVPVYDPNLVYGPWPYPGYPPYYFPGYFDGVAIGAFGIAWFAFATDRPFWGWGHMDWGHRRIDINGARFNSINAHQAAIASGVWRHNPAHRGGVPYQNANQTAQYRGVHGNANANANVHTEASHTLRGYATPAPPRETGALTRMSSPSRIAAPVAPGAGFQAKRGDRAPLSIRTPHVAPSTPALESYGPASEVRAQAARGHASRQAAPQTRSFSAARSSATVSTGPRGRGR